MLHLFLSAAMQRQLDFYFKPAKKMHPFFQPVRPRGRVPPGLPSLVSLLFLIIFSSGEGDSTVPVAPAQCDSIVPVAPPEPKPMQAPFMSIFKDPPGLVFPMYLKASLLPSTAAPTPAWIPEFVNNPNIPMNPPGISFHHALCSPYLFPSEPPLNPFGPKLDKHILQSRKRSLVLSEVQSRAVMGFHFQQGGDHLWSLEEAVSVENNLRIADHRIPQSAFGVTKQFTYPNPLGINGSPFESEAVNSSSSHNTPDVAILFDDYKPPVCLSFVCHLPLPFPQSHRGIQRAKDLHQGELPKDKLRPRKRSILAVTLIKSESLHPLASLQANLNYDVCIPNSQHIHLVFSVGKSFFSGAKSVRKSLPGWPGWDTLLGPFTSHVPTTNRAVFFTPFVADC